MTRPAETSIERAFTEEAVKGSPAMQMDPRDVGFSGPALATLLLVAPAAEGAARAFPTHGPEQTITIAARTVPNKLDQEMGQAIAGDLLQVGTHVKLNPMRRGTWLDRLHSGIWRPLNYW